ncbi:MAG: hypothetical protein OEY18_09130 [Candidatus Aminicenantes bacterium]|nr:hypothetical protein [Candidatus Aminicenantes bacterium]MDH5384857.1 hypothetical protein [Candidatus Aminicenantes bacterium]MDH5742530.1 hypothetical protein [Candidatus Aminicenantes bacterium]
MRKYFIYILSALILSPTLMADSFSLSFSQNMTNNLFQNRFAEKDQLSTFSFYLDKNLSRLSLYAEGSYSYLFKNPNLTYYVQDAGMDYLHPLNEKSAFYFSLAGRGAFYRSDYSDFNYLSANFFAAFKSYFSQTSIFKSNYSFEYKNYRDSVYDFLSHALIVSFDRYFQTNTTFKGEIDWGYKYFLHPYIYEGEVPIEGHRYFMGGRGRGYSDKQGQKPYQTVTQTEGQGLQVFSLSGLIAQGLGNSVGLNLSGVKQWVLSGQNPFSFIEEFYAVENPSYDRFSWDGYQIGSQLTFLVPWNIQLKLGYTLSKKEFPGIESLDLEGNPLGLTRKDNRNQIEVRTEKNFPQFSVFLSYSYISNSSNDLYFDWNGHFFSLGIEWNIPLGARQ